MIKKYKLFNQIKHYDWGSVSILPEFLGIKNKKKLPYAELWMGTHRSAPSRTRKNIKKVNLSEINGDLPFLFKLLAVDKPLSIQVHPNKEQAAEGFDREDRAGLSLDDPKRNYKDKNSKNEMICALSPFTLMAANNEITLQPLEALFIPCGTPHSYKSGFGIELMNNSDNVIRGGLTNKHIDMEEFNKIVSKDNFIPQIIKPAGQDVFNYPVPTTEFSLTLIRNKGKNKLPICLEDMAICIVTEGVLKIEGKKYKKGESFFVPKENKNLILEGEFVLFGASSKNFLTNSSVPPPNLRFDVCVNSSGSNV